MSEKRVKLSENRLVEDLIYQALESGGYSLHNNLGIASGGNGSKTTTNYIKLKHSDGYVKLTINVEC